MESSLRSYSRYNTFDLRKNAEVEMVAPALASWYTLKVVACSGDEEEGGIAELVRVGLA